MASSFGFAIALPIISGVLIGYFLDNKLGTKPFFTLGLLIFGLVASFYTLLKTVKKYLNQNV
ncbi:hypothetical protein COT75_03225 [Candidatus Beckwithbacteria bacterium CG10_big_fil_rev_8_21_14_0_10_34_10]|uniref:F0F1 ATP synthase subunit n=1 Tax=Candidatus Beckwithbacteria bacterium CG10_big_fil_rev_8_21_14_0_10_34_10 TaxID=1974495 RepID=A0A2H0WB17_9BACT|nr:MAG: hypothetical protein COT75_03225 [Candidatus Beckwithbacteria bacterium CG10_big_fil_rev_8_21_14_0_10_34_10]